MGRGNVDVRAPGVVLAVMSHQTRVVDHLPINAIVGEVGNRLLVRRGGRMELFEPTGTVLNHSKHEELAGTRSALTTNAEPMSVPALLPFMRVLVDGVQEQVVNEPDVSVAVGVKTISLLELEKEVLPLPPEAVRDVKPETLDAGVVNAPTKQEGEIRIAWWRTRSY